MKLRKFTFVVLLCTILAGDCSYYPQVIDTDYEDWKQDSDYLENKQPWSMQPCLGRCGANAVCVAVDRVASCTCPKGYTGDPYVNCVKFHSGKDGTGRTGGRRVTCRNCWPPNTYGTKTFRVETVKKAHWMEAYLYCRYKEGRLASIQNEKELKDVKEAIHKTGLRKETFWLGGTDDLHNGEWLWFASFEPFTVTDWNPKEPNNLFGTEHCLEYWERDVKRGYEWNDRSCSAKSYSICEYYN